MSPRRRGRRILDSFDVRRWTKHCVRAAHWNSTIASLNSVSYVDRGPRMMVKSVRFAAALVLMWFWLSGENASAAVRWVVTGIPGDGVTLASIDCYSSSRCVGVSQGSNQVIISNNAGVSWTPRSGPRQARLGFTALDCLKTGMCLATSYLGTQLPTGGAILLSVDGGRHWSVIRTRKAPSFSEYRLNSVTCSTWRDCLVAGTNGKAGFVLVSHNAGMTWWAGRLPRQPAHGTITSVACASALNCFAAQGVGALVYGSSNAGRTWHKLIVPRTFASYSSAPGVVTGLGALSCGSRSFCVAGGFIAHTRLQASTEPFKWVTNDGGVKWRFDQPFAVTGAKTVAAISNGAIDCLASKQCVLGLAYGYVYKTRNAGVAWQRDERAPRFDANVLSVSCRALTRCLVSASSNFPSTQALHGWIWRSYVSTPVR